MMHVAAAALLSIAVLASLVVTGRLRGLPFEFVSRSRLLGGWLLLFTVIYAAIALPAVLATEQTSLVVGDLSFLSLFAGHAVLVVFLLAWWRLRRPQRLARFLRIDGLRSRDLRDGVFLGVRVWLLTIAVAAVGGLVLQFFVGEGGGAGGMDAGQGADMVPEVMLWMIDLPISRKLLIILIAMTVEEAFFRAFLQTRIGLLPSSLLFAVAHASYGLPTLMVGVFIVSIVLGRDFAKHGQLVRCIIGHGVFDAIQLLIIVPFAVHQLQSMGNG